MRSQSVLWKKKVLIKKSNKDDKNVLLTESDDDDEEIVSKPKWCNSLIYLYKIINNASSETFVKIKTIL